MKLNRFWPEEGSVPRARVPVVIALGVGVVLWFVPTLLVPVLGAPIAQLP